MNNSITLSYKYAGSLPFKIFLFLFSTGFKIEYDIYQS